MELEQSIFLLEPVLDASIKNEDELNGYKNMIEVSSHCFIIKTPNGLTDNFDNIKPPTDISIYEIDCNFYKAYKGNKDIKVINPKINKVWLSSMDTRFDFLKVLEEIEHLKLSGFLEIFSKFLNIDGIMYFKSGRLINIKFNDIEKEQALPILIKTISGKVFNLNFFHIPENIVDIYASSFKLDAVEEDDDIQNISIISKSKNVLFQGMFPSGYFHIYVEDGKIMFRILNNKLVNKIDIYEPFYLATFLVEKSFIDVDIKTYTSNYRSTNVLVKPTSNDKNFVFFCPFCWNPVPQEATICPHCNSNITNFTKLPYDIKLIIALSHPIADYRITSLNVIKAKKVYLAKPFIKSIILNDDNPIVVQKAIESLVVLGDQNLCDFLSYISHHHEYAVVRNFTTNIYRRFCI